MTLTIAVSEGEGVMEALAEAQRIALRTDRSVAVTADGVTVHVHPTADLRVVALTHKRLVAAERAKARKAERVSRG